ncbi:MAG: hypothetical protein BWY95_02681 [Bacteroidetes bacterium ADurb.BinA104]|nr:MAG: hypothetical protein BWY95_02681 [Bacteroidetes bacterium ADurb.BinA104]
MIFGLFDSLFILKESGSTFVKPFRSRLILFYPTIPFSIIVKNLTARLSSITTL